jgi:anti-anti-sigma factor
MRASSQDVSAAVKAQHRRFAATFGKDSGMIKELDAPVFNLGRHGDVLVVTPRRSLSSLDERSITAEANHILAILNGEPMKNVVLDFQQTDSFGAAALGWLIRLRDRVRRCHGRMAFCHLSDHEQEILWITGLDQLWPIWASRSKALEAIESAKPDRLQRECLRPAASWR